MSEDLKQLKSGTAILVTCLVQVISESDPSFKDRFIKKLEMAYSERRDSVTDDNSHELELIAWTRELITGFSYEKGQSAPYLS